MKNSITKINIFAFVLVLSFAGFFAVKAYAQTGCGTVWTGTELIPISCTGSSTGGNNGNNDGGNNNNSNLSVNTLSATSVDDYSATLRGEIDEIGSGSYERYFQWGTSSGSLNNTVYVSGTTSSAGSFSRSLSGLQSDRTYHFRACAQRTSGSSVNDCGSVRSFTTSYSGGSNNNNSGNNNNNYVPSDISAVSTIATGVTTNSATLNGISMINAGGNGNAWFEYGLTTALGMGTPNQSVGTGTNNVSRQLTGLAPRTTYYFRIVVQNSRGTVAGEYKFFTTGGFTPVATTPTTTTPTTVKPATPAVTTTITSTTFLGLEIDSNLDKVSVGDIVTFTVSYKNVSGKDLKNITLRVELPKEMSFRKTTLGDYSKSNHSILVSILEMPKDIKGEFIVIAEVLKDAANQNILVASLEGVHNHPTIEGAQVNSINYAILEVEKGNSNLTASTFSLGKFFPTSFIGWLLIVLIIFFIILIARKLVRDKEEKEEQEKAEEGIKIAK